jgi:dTDP-4-amino-4,6-dideoxygalactose transaminase
MSFIAPAGTPISLSEVVQSVFTGSAQDSALDELSRMLASQFSVPHAWPVSSGRAAMTILLRAMSDTRGADKRREVLIPAYTCYSVPAAIERAGLRPRLCDVDPVTLGIDCRRLADRDFRNVLSVVSANLFGMPNDLARIEAICRAHGVFMLDDAAQALGSSLDGRAVGSFGSAGLTSFDRGKVISTIQGGAILASEGALATRLAATYVKLESSGFRDRMANLLKMFGYAMFLRPTLYGIVHRFPMSGLGQTNYDTSFPIGRLTGAQASLAVRLLRRLEHLSSARRVNAERFARALGDLDGVTFIRPVAGAVAAYTRFPLRLATRRQRDQAIATLLKAGIGATAFYPQALCDVPQVVAKLPAEDRHMPCARAVADTILTLPTHPYCQLDLADHVRKALMSCLR